jgi:hypothetical protein
MVEKRITYRLLVAKSEGNRLLGRAKWRCMDNIKMDLVEIGFGGVDWIGPVKDRFRWISLVTTVINFRVAYNAGKLSSGYRTGGLSSSAQHHRISQLVNIHVQIYS